MTRFNYQSVDKVFIFVIVSLFFCLISTLASKLVGIERDREREKESQLLDVELQEDILEVRSLNLASFLIIFPSITILFTFHFSTALFAII